MYAGERQFKEPALQTDWSDLSQFVNLPISLHQGGCRFIRLALYSVEALSLAPIPCNVIPALFFVQLHSVGQ